MRVLNHANLSPHTLAEIEGELRDQQNLKDMKRLGAREMPGAIRIVRNAKT